MSGADLTELTDLTMPEESWDDYAVGDDCIAYPDDPDDWLSESDEE